MAEGPDHRVVAFQEVAPAVDGQVHRRGVLVEVAVAVLQLLQLAVGPAELVVGLDQLLGPPAQLGLVAELGRDVGEVASEVEDPPSGP